MTGWSRRAGHQSNAPGAVTSSSPTDRVTRRRRALHPPRSLLRRVLGRRFSAGRRPPRHAGPASPRHQPLAPPIPRLSRLPKPERKCSGANPRRRRQPLQPRPAIEPKSSVHTRRSRNRGPWRMPPAGRRSWRCRPRCRYRQPQPTSLRPLSGRPRHPSRHPPAGHKSSGGRRCRQSPPRPRQAGRKSSEAPPRRPPLRQCRPKPTGPKCLGRRRRAPPSNSRRQHRFRKRPNRRMPDLSLARQLLAQPRPPRREPPKSLARRPSPGLRFVLPLPEGRQSRAQSLPVQSMLGEARPTKPRRSPSPDRRCSLSLPRLQSSLGCLSSRSATVRAGSCCPRKGRAARHRCFRDCTYPG
jgi:hypothetical protein